MDAETSDPLSHPAKEPRALRNRCRAVSTTANRFFHHF